MRDVFLCVLVTLVAASMASATVAWVEDWESYTSGVTPYDNWVFGNGVWEPLTGGGQAHGAQAYRVVGGTITRIGKELGFDASAQVGVTLEGWFYDTNGASSTKRTWLGFQQGWVQESNAMVRIGMNNLGSYQVQYYNNGAARNVSTNLSMEPGWHYVKLDMVKNPINWTCNWQINAVNGTPYTGSFSWGWAAASATRVILGYNGTCATEIDWDDIRLSYTPVGAQAVPEPCAIALGAMGLAGLIGIRRRTA